MCVERKTHADMARSLLHTQGQGAAMVRLPMPKSQLETRPMFYEGKGVYTSSTACARGVVAMAGSRGEPERGLVWLHGGPAARREGGREGGWVAGRGRTRRRLADAMPVSSLVYVPR